MKQIIPECISEKQKSLKNIKYKKLIWKTTVKCKIARYNTLFIKHIICVFLWNMSLVKGFGSDTFATD